MSKFNAIETIKGFLIYSAKNGYGNLQAKTTDETDGSHTIEVTKGNLRLHDNYFGGEPYGGREAIFKDGKPVWMMVYYGRVYESAGLTLQDIYGFLRKCLLNPDSNMPIRGPLKYQEAKLSYAVDIKGDITDFICEEVIKYDGKMLYKATFAGGLVAQQND